jgi:hypothetical protein
MFCSDCFVLILFVFSTREDLMMLRDIMERYPNHPCYIRLRHGFFALGKGEQVYKYCKYTLEPYILKTYGNRHNKL